MMKIFRDQICRRLKPASDKIEKTGFAWTQNSARMKHIILCALVFGMLGLMFFGVQGGYARDIRSNELEVSIREFTRSDEVFATNGLIVPSGLYVQEWSSGWITDWDGWAVGAHNRVYGTSVQSDGHAWPIYNMLANLPTGKKAIIGFSPKNNTKNCWFGMWSQYYTNTKYSPIQLIDEKGKPASRQCGGESIDKAVNFLDQDVQDNIKAKVKDFVEYYTNNSPYKDKVAGFEFASGVNLEGTPWVHPLDGTITDPGHEAERGLEKTTYMKAYTGTVWAEYNLAFAHWVDDALENAGSNKIAYFNYTQTWPDEDAWQKVIHCIGGESNDLCPDPTGEGSPITSGRIGLKYSGLAADTLTGGSKLGVCSWYDPDLGWFWGDWWKMMRWAKSKGLSTAWEFNNDHAKAPLDQVYSDERAHLRHSLAMALNYGADVILIYQANADQTDILEWASHYVGKDVDATLDQPVWIMMREAIEDNNEEVQNNFDANSISDPEDIPTSGYPYGNDGFVCKDNQDDDCSCGHDVETAFGLTSDDVNGMDDTSFGKVMVDSTLYGATARRPTSDQIKFAVDDDYWGNDTQAKIMVRYKLIGNHPVLKYWRKDTGNLATLPNNNHTPVPNTSDWYEATFIADQPYFGDGNTHGYDFAIDSSSGGLDWIDYVEVARQNVTPPPTPPPTPTPTPTPTPEPVPFFHERMETAPPGGFSSWYVANGASLTRVSDQKLEGSYAWKCAEGSQLQNWPECAATYVLPSPQNQLTVQYAVRVKEAVTQLGPALWTSNGYLWPYFDLSNQIAPLLHHISLW